MVLLHEFGHMIAAKKSRVKVEEFGIWIPPRILTLYQDKSGTKYSLNLLPLWWFVRLKWEDLTDPKSFEDKDSFWAQPLKNKVAILLWWIAMNLILAWLFLTIGFAIWVKPLMVLPTNMLKIETNSYLFPTYQQLEQMGILKSQAQPVKIEWLLPDSLAQQIWLTTGYKILKIDQQAINTQNIWTILKSYIGKEFTLIYQHQDQIQQTKVSCPQDQCLLGILMEGETFDYPTFKFSLPQASLVATKEIWEETRLTFFMIGDIFKKLFSFDKKQINKATQSLHSPVLVVKFWQNIFETLGRGSLIAFLGLISFSLAIFNLLPIPALDWWRLLSVIIQHITKIDAQTYFTKEAYANIIFFVLLMALGLFIVFKDIVLLKSMS